MASGGTPKIKNGAPRDELKDGRGCGWPSLTKTSGRPSNTLKNNQEAAKDAKDHF